MHPDCWSGSLDDIIRQVDALMAARAELAATPPAPTREAAPVPQQGAEISDRELLELMPQQLRNAFAEAARCCSQSTGGAAVFRVVLNTGALDYARAVWARAQAALPAADQQEGQSDA
jgi:hypothetical protein